MSFWPVLAMIELLLLPILCGLVAFGAYRKMEKHKKYQRERYEQLVGYLRSEIKILKGALERR